MKPIFLLGEQLLVCLALVAFLTGFMNLQPSATHNQRAPPAPKLTTVPTKVVLMVIDGLRTDHVYKLMADLDSGGVTTLQYQNYMPYLSEQLMRTEEKSTRVGTVKQTKTGGALCYEMSTFTPTVTAPRLQSLVSGIIPGFLSIATNFGASKVTEDNLIRRWKNAGRRLRMYGDETWLKLFPDVFDESDPVTSFFVSDHKQVDENVTRNIGKLFRGGGEEDRKRLDAVILHYLGVDHLGHTHGHMGPLMQDKLRQMNEVIWDVHLSLLTLKEPFVFVVCGDHGMLDGGGHGGSEFNEIHTAAVIISSADLKRSVRESFRLRQVDLASTLGVITGVGAPASSVGVPVLQLVRPSLDAVGLYKLYKSEAQRLLELLKAAGLPYRDPSALMVEAEWIEAKNFDYLHKIDTEDSNPRDASTNITSNRINDPINKSNSVTQKASDDKPNDSNPKENNSNTQQQAQRDLDPEILAKLSQLSSLYHSACQKASDTLVTKMQTYDLPVLIPSAALVFMIALSRMVYTIYQHHSSGSSRLYRHYYYSTATQPRFSTILNTMVVCLCVVLLGWSLLCGVVNGGGGSSTTQFCRATSTVVWLLLLPAVYAVALTGLVASKVMCAVDCSWFTGAFTWLFPCAKSASGRQSTAGNVWKSGSYVRALLLCGSLAQSLSLFGTSFVEEEHQTYYFLHTSFLAVVLLLTLVLAFDLSYTRSAESSVSSDQNNQSREGFPDHCNNSVEKSKESSTYDSVLLRRNECLRRNMRKMYDQFGLNSQITSSMDGLLKETDGNLDEVLKSSERQQRQQNENKIRYKLAYSCLAILVSLILFRLSRTWNATGNKWKHLSDFSVIVRSLPHPYGTYIMLLALALLLGFIGLCQPVLLVAFAHLYGKFHPFTGESNGTVEIMIVYVCAFIVLAYGFLRNAVYHYVFIRIGKDTNLSQILLSCLGAIKLKKFGRRDRRLPTLPTTNRNLSEKVEPKEKFITVMNRCNSNSFLLSEILKYVYASLAVIWLLLQREDNVILCCLLLIQSKLVVYAVVALGTSGADAFGNRSGKGSAGCSKESFVVTGVASLAVMWMAQAFFFAQGNSNSLSTINLAAGFVGISHYSPVLHGALIALYTLGAPLLVYLQYLQHLLASAADDDADAGGSDNATNRSFVHRLLGRGWWKAVSPALMAWWCARLWCIGLYLCNVVMHRDHLFIFSVYAPKLVYECVHLLLLVLVQVLLMVLAAVAT